MSIGEFTLRARSTLASEVPELMTGIKYESLLLLERCRGDLCECINILLSWIALRRLGSKLLISGYG